MIKHLFVAFILSLSATICSGETMRMAVTTSFHNSGLADVLIPAIKADTGIEVQLLVVGTGQALKLGRAGDVDAILVHSPAAEKEFIAQGFAPYRREIMYNDFVIVGPRSDPAKIQTAHTVPEAMQRLQIHPFVSRGDESGTHKMELMLWETAGIDPIFLPASNWYISIGGGMGTALNTANALHAYTLSDRGSWLNFGNKNGLMIVFEGDEILFNQYAYLPISVQKHPHLRHDLAQRVEIWLTSARAQALIDGYKINGEPAFVFNAR